MGAGINPETRSVIEGSFPEDDPTIQEAALLKEEFPDRNVSVLIFVCDDGIDLGGKGNTERYIFETTCLEKIREVTEKAAEFAGVVGKVFSLTDYPYIRADANGDLIVSNLIKEIPVDEDGLYALKELVMNDPLLMGRLVTKPGDSKSGSMATLVWFRFGDKEVQETVFTQLEGLMARFSEYDGPNEEAIFSMHHLNVSIEKRTQQEIAVNIMAAFIAIGSLMWATLGWRAALMIIPTIAFSVVWGMGIMGWLGYPQNVLTGALPLLIAAVVSSHCFHFMKRLIDEYENSHVIDDVVRESLAGVAPSIVQAGVTSTVGFATLYMVEIFSVAEFGLYCAAGIAAGALLSVVFLPALVLYNDRTKNVARKGKTRVSVKIESMVLQGLVVLRQIVFNHRLAVLVSSALIVLFSSYGVTKLEVSSNPPEMFAEVDPYRKGIQVFLDYYNATGFGEIGVWCKDTIDVNDPQCLRDIDEFTRRLAEHPEVAFTVSYPERIKRLYGVFEGVEDQIPENRNQVAQLAMLDDQEFQSDYVTSDYSLSRLDLFMDSRDSNVVLDIYEYAGIVAAEVSASLGILRGGEFFKWIVFPKYVVEGKLKSGASTLVLMFVLLSYFWLRIRLAAVGIIPISFTTLFVMGLMGVFAISLDIANMSVATLTCCIAIDFAVHYVNRVREQTEKGFSVEDAVEIALYKGGIPIVYDCISNCAFGFLMLSTFVPLWNLGFLMVISMTTALVATLVILPSAVLQYPLVVGVKLVDITRRQKRESIAVSGR